MYNVGFFKNSH